MLTEATKCFTREQRQLQSLVASTFRARDAMLLLGHAQYPESVSGDLRRITSRNIAHTTTKQTKKPWREKEKIDKSSSSLSRIAAVASHLNSHGSNAERGRKRNFASLLLL